MCRIRVLFALSGAWVLAAQAPPAQDAVLIAGAAPTPARATETAMAPLAVAPAPDGSLFVAEQQRVWRVSTSGSIVSVPGPWDTTPSLITAIAADRSGNLFVAEVYQHVIWKVAPQGQVTAIAGQGPEPLAGPGPVPANSVAAMASALVVDAQGNLYASGNNARVWKITPGGILTAFAGSGGISSPAASAVAALEYGLIYPGRLAADAAGNIYINDASGLLRVSPDGLLRRISTAGLPPVAVVTAIAVDSAGELVAGFRLASGYSGQAARIGSDGGAQVIAGTGEDGFSDGCTPGAAGVPRAIRAALHVPSDIAVDADGNVIIADPGNSRVRKVTPGGGIETVAGGPGGAFAGDGQAATQALLAHPAGLALDSAGHLYFADRDNHRIRRIDAGGPALEARLDTPAGLSFAFGNLYIAEKQGVRVIDPGGRINTIYAQLTDPGAVAVDAAGNVYSGGIELSHDGHLFFLPVRQVRALAVGPAGEVYSSSDFYRLARTDPDCAVTTLAPYAPPFEGIAVAPNGDLFVADSTANRIWRIPAPAPGGGTVPLSFPLVSLVNGATLTPRTVWVTSYTSPFHIPIQVPVSANEAVAPGETVAVTGQCLAPLRFQAGSVEGGRVATSIGDTRVLVNGVPAPLLSATANQVVAVVPYETAGQVSATLELTYHGQRAGLKLETAATSVGIFPPAGAVFAAGSVAALLITGEGVTSPPRLTGQVAADAHAAPAAPVHVKVGDTEAEVISAAPDAGTIGSLRVTFRIPESIQPGPAVITVSIGASSNAVTVRVTPPLRNGRRNAVR